MSGAAPWSVKGIEPRTREVAKDLARRSGMTLGEWLSEMITEGDEDEAYTPLSQRTSLRDIARDTGRRSRRGEDSYVGEASTLSAIEQLSARLEAAERRSAMAIEGVDKVVGGIVRRFEALQDDADQRDRRIDSIGEELREGRTRLRSVETELGPNTAESIAKIEQSISRLGSQMFDAEAKGRDAGAVLRERMDRFEREHSAERLIDTAAARVAARLEEAQARTAQSLARLELSFADLDRRMVASERSGGSRDNGAFERLADQLSRRVEESRTELLRRMETTVSDPRVDRFDRTLSELSNHVQASERRSVEALETMGREVLRIAENLNGRVTDTEAAQAQAQERAIKAVESMGQELSRTLSNDMAKVTDAIDQRMRRADDQHALALERLGGEISRISERLAERIGQGERRAAQSVDELGERVTRASEKMETRYERASGELSERMRQSEERTAALLAEARDSIDRQLARRASQTEFAADWRDTSFPQADFASDWAAPTTPVDPAFPANPVFIDEPSLMDDVVAASADDDVFEPAAPAGFAPPVFSEPEPVAAGIEEPIQIEIAPQAAADDIGDDIADDIAAIEDEAVLDDDVAIETYETAAEAPAFASSQPDPDSYDVDTEFLDAAPAAPQRPMTTREALAAARATAADDIALDDQPRRNGFGFMGGGKSRLQKRMEKQSKAESTVRKALIATTTAVVVVGGGVAGLLGYQRLVAEGSAIPALPTAQSDLMAASAISPTPPEIAPPAPEAEARGRTLFEQATGLIAAGDAEGVRVMSQAANLGYPQAQFALARLYETGESGVTADPAEARRWTERAARGGEARAMHNLALYMFEGTGGARDQAGSLQWFQAAAERGLVDSQYNLGRLYETGGEGLTTDPVRAYQWYLVASRAGDAEARTGAERLEPTLTTAQRLQAEGQAERFRVEPTTDQG